MNTVFYLKCMS